jgi:uncharacterized cupin superfamily protein
MADVPLTHNPLNEGDVVVRLGDAEAITEHDRREIVLLAAHDDITVTWSRYAPGGPGPDLHVHREHTDAFYVLEGELTFAVGPQAERTSVAAGGFVAVPPDGGFADLLRRTSS